MDEEICPSLAIFMMPTSFPKSTSLGAKRDETQGSFGRDLLFPAPFALPLRHINIRFLRDAKAPRVV